MIKPTTLKESPFCPCCGYNTFKPSIPNLPQECRVCVWEEDIIQSINPNNYDGVNGVSLLKAQENFEKFGVCSKEMISKATKPIETDVRNPNWK